MGNYSVVKEFCTSNGPGVRTSIYLSGCNLHCESGCDAGEAEDEPDGAERGGGPDAGEPVSAENREGQGGPLLHSGRHLQGPGLPARGHSGIPGGGARWMRTK